MKKCNHDFEYDGIVNITVEKAEQQWSEVHGVGRPNAEKIQMGETFFPSRYQYHCRKCCQVRRLK